MAGSTGDPLGLYLPGGGSLGIGGQDETADVDKLNQNFQALNTFAAQTNGKISDLGASAFFTGLEAERTAMTPPVLRNGILFNATDSGKLWEYKQGAWVEYLPSGTPFAMAAGKVSVGIGFPTVTFPTGRFTQPPIVTAQLYSGAGSDIGVVAMVTSITTTNFKLRHTGTTGTREIMWTAVQMTPTSAAG